MSNISFRYCPVYGGELDTGKVVFPPSRTIFAEGAYYSDKIIKELHGHPVKKILRGPDKTFNSSGDNPSGYCKKCGKIFMEFKVTGSLIDDEMLLTYDMDYYNESADNLYDDKIVSYYDDNDEKYNTIDGYKILTDSIKFKKSED